MKVIPTVKKQYLTPEEEGERINLQLLRLNKQRWFSQEEFDRLIHLTQKRYHAVCEEIKELMIPRQYPQWTKTSEGLPTDYGPIWFFTKGKVIRGNYHEHTKEFVGQMGAEYAEAEVSHWMPFIQPEPPKIG